MIRSQWTVQIRSSPLLILHFCRHQTPSPLPSLSLSAALSLPPLLASAHRPFTSLDLPLRAFSGRRRTEMLLRKRPRPPMRRTTSMTEFAAEVEGPLTADQVGAESQSRHPHLLQKQRNQRRAAEAALWRSGGGGGRRRNFGEFAMVEAAPFLMACGLCKRRLGPGRDTFMYRYFSSAASVALCLKRSIFLGGVGFLAVLTRKHQDHFVHVHLLLRFCRQQHMNQAEPKEKCSLTSMKDTPPATNGSESSDGGETVAAA
ncbi:hypothetical protein B296_00046459 [Ensete ventricosum]|uniref:FLZ-type domain-containing protein n=1 Tax=Ensete ventricosum TaxID=4639 RepID=A0A426X655_ENSVE|nr:hypothetical protein B296_00046459 [Ensete ventricosum]